MNAHTTTGIGEMAAPMECMLKKSQLQQCWILSREVQCWICTRSRLSDLWQSHSAAVPAIITIIVKGDSQSR